MPWEEGADGPEVPPLLPGLPHTPIEACRELMLAIVAQGIADKDLRYILSPEFIHHCCYVGLDPDTAFGIKIAYLRGQVDSGNLSQMRLHRDRFADRAETAWKSWSVSASR